MLLIQSIGPRRSWVGTEKVISHVKWGTRAVIVLLFCGSLFATSIVIRSDGKKIAIAADSKSDKPGSFCKVRVIRWGVVVAGGYASATQTSNGRTTTIYDALQIGVEAADGLTEPWKMVDRFTVLFEPKAQDFIRVLLAEMNRALSVHADDALKQINAAYGDMLKGGAPLVQIAYAVNHNGKVAFYRRQFFSVPIIRDGAPFITYRDESCPGTCNETSRRDAYTAVGIDDISNYVGVHPEMFSRPPLEFSTFFVQQVIHDFGSMAGEPITTVTLENGDRPWHFHDIPPCETEAQKAASYNTEPKK